MGYTGPTGQCFVGFGWEPGRTEREIRLRKRHLALMTRSADAALTIVAHEPITITSASGPFVIHSIPSGQATPPSDPTDPFVIHVRTTSDLTGGVIESLARSIRAHPSTALRSLAVVLDAQTELTWRDLDRLHRLGVQARVRMLELHAGKPMHQS